MSKSYLVINNVAKRNNARDLCLTGFAHKSTVLLTGFHIEELHLERPLSLGLQIERFECLADCKQHLSDRGVPLFGIEIMDTARSILDATFATEAVAFMPGNEGTGLSATQKSVCDGFIYIPQFGKGTASLNVNVATCVTLHSFHSRSDSISSGSSRIHDTMHRTDPDINGVEVI